MSIGKSAALAIVLNIERFERTGDCDDCTALLYQGGVNIAQHLVTVLDIYLLKPSKYYTG